MNKELKFPEIVVDGDDEAKLKAGATQIVTRIRTDWKRENLRYKIFTDGITNKLIGVCEGPACDMILIRVYGQGSELLVDRAAEIRNMKLLAEADCGAHLYATFGNGLAYQFIPGDVLTLESVRDPIVFPAIAKTMARMHKIPMADKTPCMWKRLRQFADASPDGFPDDPTKQERFEAVGFSKDQLYEEIKEMEAKLSSTNSAVVFCHNDALLANIVISKNEIGDVKVDFIDYEYGAPNYQAFDIGDHFTEFVGVGGHLDYEKLYPDFDFQRKWIREYLTEFHDGQDVTEDQVNETLVQVNQFSLCANLCWGIWSLVQAKVSAIDFDFVDYAQQRLHEYKRGKKLFLDLGPKKIQS